MALPRVFHRSSGPSSWVVAIDFRWCSAPGIRMGVPGCFRRGRPVRCPVDWRCHRDDGIPILVFRAGRDLGSDLGSGISADQGRWRKRSSIRVSFRSSEPATFPIGSNGARARWPGKSPCGIGRRSWRSAREGRDGPRCAADRARNGWILVGLSGDLASQHAVWLATLAQVGAGGSSDPDCSFCPVLHLVETAPGTRWRLHRFGPVIEGLDAVNAIRRANGGAADAPDRIVSAAVATGQGKAPRASVRARGRATVEPIRPASCKASDRKALPGCFRRGDRANLRAYDP